MLTIAIFLPTLAALVIALTPRSRPDLPRAIALVFSLVVLALAAIMFVSLDRGFQGFQFTNHVTWVRTSLGGFSFQYYVGLDGISAALVLLTAFLNVVAVLVSWGIALRPKEYFIWLLVIESGVLGVFSSLDLLLFFLFWEVELVPMYLLISIWGSGRKEYSATKFVLYTVAGSSFMIVGILALGFTAHTFEIPEIMRNGVREAAIPLGFIFFALFSGFAVKLPMFPLHTWLPDAHTDAPTAVSVILAGALLKMGGYGIIRLCVGLLPQTAHDWGLAITLLGAIGVVYGALVTLRQTDLKRLIAYSSVSHMGFVLIGVGALGQLGLTGATVQMVTHGLVTGMLFVMVGLVYERTHTRQIPELGGLARQMPWIAAAFVVAGVASLGLPMLAGFVGEVVVFLGAFSKYAATTIVAVSGVVLAAGYILWMLQRVFFGPPKEQWAHLGDARHWSEWLAMGAMTASIVAVGIYPQWIIDAIDHGVVPIASRLG